LTPERWIWAGGVAAPSIGSALAKSVGADTDKNGRIKVGYRLNLSGFRDIFMIGVSRYVSMALEDRYPVLPRLRCRGAYAARAIRGHFNKRKFKYAKARQPFTRGSV
jgi:NADH dehydrogenase FAD-containing subunit